MHLRNNMAFILPVTTPFMSSFVGNKPSAIARYTFPSHVNRLPKMALADHFLAGAGALVITGAIVVSTFTLNPSQADASLFQFSGDKPTNIGLRYGRYLDACPPSPNCISSSANVYDSHYVPSWTYNAIDAQAKKTMAQAIKDVTKAIEDFPGTNIIKSEATKSDVGAGYYIYAEFQSKIFGFVDDVEFFFQPDNTTVEYRSASRLGENDLGANRKRIRDLRVALQGMDKQWASTGF